VIDRRAFLATIGAGILAAPLAVEAQQAGRVWRLGILHPGASSSPGWLKDLRELGYAEGQNLILERRYAAGKPEQLPALAAALVSLKVDAIVAISSVAIRAAKNATTTIPVVMAFGITPVELGLVASLARPGGNVMGVAYAAEGSLVPKRLQLLKEMVPMAKRIGALDDGGPEFRHRFKEAESVARALDVQLVVVDARPGRYEQAFADMKAHRIDALYAGGSPIHNQDRKQLVALAARHRLPAIWEWRHHVEGGGLISYGANISALDRRVAIYIDRVFKGANPAELPVEQPSEFELAINLKTAKTLGLTIPQSLLLRADQVIQ
jgi:putative ABC transport system substrate-binding protein